MIVKVTEENLYAAGFVHSVSWQESHRKLCTPDFLAKHTPERQSYELAKALRQGEKAYLLLSQKRPVGIISICENLIENLYILPDEQNKGYGSKLLSFALKQCTGTATLWILNTNKGACRLYSSFGFRKTGNCHQLSEHIFEFEMSRTLSNV